MPALLSAWTASCMRSRETIFHRPTAASADRAAVEAVPTQLTISLVNAETGAVVYKTTKTAAVTKK